MVSELREPLDLPIKSRLTVTEDESARASRKREAKLSKGPAQIGTGAEDDVAQGRQEVRESDDEKIRMIDARRPDYKAAIQDALLESGAAFAVYTIDDFYLINPRAPRPGHRLHAPPSPRHRPLPQGRHHPPPHPALEDGGDQVRRLCSFAAPVVMSGSAGPATTERGPEGAAEWLPAAVASEALPRVWAAAG